MGVKYDVIIVGGGPAGCSSAISLADGGLNVLMLEAKHMPRQKLCGEFIAPESFPTLERLGVLKRVLDLGQKITRLSLCAPGGRQIQTMAGEVWRSAEWAIGLSRARLDQLLFDRARESGVSCLEGISVKRCLFHNGAPYGVEGTDLSDGRSHFFNGSLVIDASGRNSRLTVDDEERRGGRSGSRLYALKAHLKPIVGINDQVELYFFPHGYGGLSRIEDGLINLCFIADETVVRNASGDPDHVVRETILQNPVARARLEGFEPVGKWHSAGPLTFGHRRLARAGVITIGDASGMIDPFTGSGIFVALRTGEVAAESILRAVQTELGVVAGQRLAEGCGRIDIPYPPLSFIEKILVLYRARYEQEIGGPMRTAAFLRRAAFSVSRSNLVAVLLSSSPRLARRVIRATQGGVAFLDKLGGGYAVSGGTT